MNAGTKIRRIGIAVCLFLVTHVLSASPAAATQGTIHLGDFVWQDLNGNGIQDPGEPGLPGIRIELYKNGHIGQYRPQQTTPANGHYEFTDLDGGTYRLRFIVPSYMSEWTFVAPNQGGDPTKDSDPTPLPTDPTIAEITGIYLWLSDNLNEDAGLTYYLSCNSAYPGLALGGYIWRDIDRNGLRGQGEDGLAGVDLDLWRVNRSIFPPYGDYFTGRTTRTYDSGFYQFECLPEGAYYVVVKNLNDFDRTHPYKDPDADVPGDQNYYDPLWQPSGHRFRSGTVTLTPGGEPGGGGKENKTIDGGFTCLDAAIDVVVVIDKSGSMGNGTLKNAKEDAYAVLQALGRGGEQRAAVIAFADSASIYSSLPAPISEDQAVLLNPQTITAGGDTLLWTGLDLAVAHLQQQGVANAPHVIVVLSDGKDSDKNHAKASAANAKANGITVVTWAEGNDIDASFLGQIASPGLDSANPIDADIAKFVEETVPRGCTEPAHDEVVCTEGQATSVDISTGLYPWKVSDHDTQSFQPVHLVSPLSGNWGTLSGSQWVSRFDTGDSIPGIGRYVYRVYFQLPSNADRTRIVFDAYADDGIERSLVALNDVYSNLPSTGGNGLAGVPYHFDVTGYPYWWVRPGQTNWLDVYVADGGIKTGLNLRGRVSWCPAGSAINPPSPDLREVRVVGFIPVDNEDDPRNLCHHSPIPCPPFFGPSGPFDYVFTGDLFHSHDRTNDLGNPWQDSPYRFRVRAVINPHRAWDTGNRGLVSQAFDAGTTKMYEKASSLDVNADISSLARADTTEWDNDMLHWTGHTHPDPLIISTNWENDHAINLNIEFAAADPQSPLAPKVDMRWNLTIDANDPQKNLYEFGGYHDGYPSFDVLVDCEEIYHHDASNSWIDMLPPDTDTFVLRQSCEKGTCGQNHCSP